MYLLNLFDFYRLVGFDWFSNRTWAQPMETDFIRHTSWKYPRETACCTSRPHRDNSTPPAQPLSRGIRRPQTGFRRWMPDVVCQFVGIGIVPWYVMKRGGQFERLLCDMEKGSMWTRQRSVFEALSFPLGCTYANSSWFFQQWRGMSRCQPSEVQRLTGCGTGRELTRCFTHVPGRCQPKWKRAYIASVHILCVCNSCNACLWLFFR